MKMVPDDAAPGYRALMELLRAADTVWNASRLFFEAWDLSPSQFNVLNLLRLNPGGLSQTELGLQLIMHRSNVTGLVDRLEKRGLVVRHAVPGDRRAYRVVLAGKAAKLLEQILPAYYENAVRVSGPISARRAEELIRELKAVARNAERIASEEAK